jgi:hypothetical protein
MAIPTKTATPAAAITAILQAAIKRFIHSLLFLLPRFSASISALLRVSRPNQAVANDDGYTGQKQG